MKSVNLTMEIQAKYCCGVWQISLKLISTCSAYTTNVLETKYLVV